MSNEVNSSGITRFTVVYIGKGIFRLCHGNNILIVGKFDNVNDIQQWAKCFCSSWSSYHIDFQIDQFLKEKNYVG
jgi:hypothetical protein